jgi:hypothetical protein
MGKAETPMGFREPADNLTEEEAYFVDRLVIGANPVPSLAAVIGSQQLAALDSMRQAILAQPRAGRHLSARLKIATALLAAAFVIAGTTAATNWVRVHTGMFGASGMTENDTSEWLRQDSPEILALVDRFTLDYELPPGGSWIQVKKRWPTKEPSYVQVTGVEAAVAGEAMCQWQGYWLASYVSGDLSGQQAALRVLDAAPDWPIVRKTDGGGFADNLRMRARYAHEGNVEQFRHLYQLNCAV